jgi:hypothetical protein
MERKIMIHKIIKTAACVALCVMTFMDLEATRHQLRWTQVEDASLIFLVKQYGARNWNGIAGFMHRRNGKQCRERWKTNLSESLNKAPWTEDEDALLIAKQKELGNKWSEISKFLQCRSTEGVRNRWKVILRAEKKLTKQRLKTNKDIAENYNLSESVWNKNQNGSLLIEKQKEMLVNQWTRAVSAP